MRGDGERQREGGEAEADDDGGQHQRLGQRIGGAGGRRLGPGRDQRGRHGGETAGDEDDHARRPAEKRDAEHHLQQVARQHQIDARGREDAGENGEHPLHQASSSSAKTSPSTAPSTTSQTPKSKRSTVESGSPSPFGPPTKTQTAAKGASPTTSGISPARSAAPTPSAATVAGGSRSASRAVSTPWLMASSVKEEAATSPPMKPPPGASCPRTSRNSENTISSVEISRVAACRIGEVMPRSSASGAAARARRPPRRRPRRSRRRCRARGSPPAPR